MKSSSHNTHIGAYTVCVRKPWSHKRDGVVCVPASRYHNTNNDNNSNNNNDNNTNINNIMCRTTVRVCVCVCVGGGGGGSGGGGGGDVCAPRGDAQ